jgi:hypothetical protein
MLLSQVLPEAINDARCRNCSLFDACLLDVVGRPARERSWRSALFRLSDE